jgi:hypothetical protein
MQLRKTISIFALCLAALLPMCLSGIYIAGRILIRVTMMEKMEKNELQTISIPTDQIRWFKKNHELMIDGKMFDVKSISKQGDTSIITGLFDDDDTELHEALAGMHEQKNKGQNNALLLYQVCLGIIAVNDPFINQPIAANFECIKISFAQYEDNILQSYLPIFSPPPKSAWS